MWLLLCGVLRFTQAVGAAAAAPPEAAQEVVPAPARRGPLEVVEDALDRAARVGLDGDEAEDVLGAQRGEGLAGVVEGGVEPQARLRERLEEAVVVEPPRAARRDLCENQNFG